MNRVARTQSKLLTERFLAYWARFLAVHIAVTALVFTILTPAAAFLLRLAVSLSGEAALSDQDILFFFLTPAGFAGLILLAAVFSVIIFLEHAALLTVARAAGAGAAATITHTLGFLAGRMVRLFRLALLVLLRVLLNLLPFVLLLLAIYRGLLSSYDINYYLAERPPEWRLALLLGGIVVVACAANLLRLFTNWVFCLPLLLFGHSSPRQSLTRSRDAVRGHRKTVAAWLLGWLGASLLTTVLISRLVGLSGNYLIPLAAHSMKTLLLALGLTSLISFVLYFAVAFFFSTCLSLLILQLYQNRGLPLERGAPVGGPASGSQPRLASRRFLIWALPAAFSVALLVAYVGLMRLPLETRTEIMAHRGASAAAPENTLAAIERAIESGAHWVEIDVQETADDRIVVIHDSDLKKIGGSALKVAESTLTELQDVDIGSWFGAEFADQRVPSLEEVLKLCKGRIGVNIELKYYGRERQLERRVAEIVEAAGMTGQVMFMSLNYAGIRTLRRLRPGWTVGLLSSVALGNLAQLDVDFLALNGRAASRHLIRQAHRNGKRVMVWTVNDAVAMASMIGRGADALITDEPALAVSVLEGYRDLEPAERLLIQLADVFDRPSLYREQ
jgi:glycerophosphoryl diester phosphodiesterase